MAGGGFVEFHGAHVAAGLLCEEPGPVSLPGSGVQDRTGVRERSEVRGGPLVAGQVAHEPVVLRVPAGGGALPGERDFGQHAGERSPCTS